MRSFPLKNVAIVVCATLTFFSGCKSRTERDGNSRVSEIGENESDKNEITRGQIEAEIKTQLGIIETNEWAKLFVRTKRLVMFYKDQSKPKRFDLRGSMSMNCEQLLKGKDFVKVSSAFERMTADNQHRICLVVSFASKDPAEEISMIRLSMDSSYEPYLLEVDRRRGLSDEEIRYTEFESPSSKQWPLPFDIPNLATIAREIQNETNTGTSSSFPQKITDPNRVKTLVEKVKAMDRSFQFCDDADQREFSYLAPFVGRQDILWCQGKVWPSIIENSDVVVLIW